jgi:hypothetical protein
MTEGERCFNGDSMLKKAIFLSQLTGVIDQRSAVKLLLRQLNTRATLTRKTIAGAL